MWTKVGRWVGKEIQWAISGGERSRDGWWEVGRCCRLLGLKERQGGQNASTLRMIPVKLYKVMLQRGECDEKTIL